jgi:Uma2 family endonuclease
MNAPTMPPQLRGFRPKLLLDQNSNGMLMSLDEFDAITIDDCDRRFRYELLHGVIIVSPPPSDGEVAANDDLGHLLRKYQESPEGKALDASLYEREVITNVGVRRVDRAIWTGFGRQIHSKLDLPTIVVEFVSPGKKAWLRDYEQKRGEYLDVGCKEYWVIDRFRRTMTVYFPPPAEPSERVVTETEIYTTPLLPGFELPLARLLKLADRFADDDG